VAEIAEEADAGMCLLILCGDFVPGEADTRFDGIIKVGMTDLEAAADQIYKILDTLLAPSQVNLDLADLKTVLTYGRRARVLYSEWCDSDLAHQHKQCPQFPVHHDTAALIHITGGEHMSVMTVKEVCDSITRGVEDGLVILGIRIEKGCRRVKILSILTDPEARDYRPLGGAYHTIAT
jgi:cell division GTPase FtsZ